MPSLRELVAEPELVETLQGITEPERDKLRQTVAAQSAPAASAFEQAELTQPSALEQRDRTAYIEQVPDPVTGTQGLDQVTTTDVKPGSDAESAVFRGKPDEPEAEQGAADVMTEPTSPVPAVTAPTTPATPAERTARGLAANRAAARAGEYIALTLPDVETAPLTDPETGKQMTAKEYLAAKTQSIAAATRLLRDTAKEDRQSIGWMRLAEQLGHALGKIGAGLYGLKHGVDIASGMQFDKTDWQSQVDAVNKDLDRELGLYREEKQGAEQHAEKAMNRFQAENEFRRAYRLRQQERAEDKAEQAAARAAAASSAAAAAKARKEERELDRQHELTLEETRQLGRVELQDEKTAGQQQILRDRLQGQREQLDSRISAQKEMAANRLTSQERQQLIQIGADRDALTKRLQSADAHLDKKLAADAASLNKRIQSAEGMLRSKLDAEEQRAWDRNELERDKLDARLEQASRPGASGYLGRTSIKESLKDVDKAATQQTQRNTREIKQTEGAIKSLRDALGEIESNDDEMLNDKERGKIVSKLDDGAARLTKQAGEETGWVWKKTKINREKAAQTIRTMIAEQEQKINLLLDENDAVAEGASATKQQLLGQ